MGRTSVRQAAVSTDELYGYDGNDRGPGIDALAGGLGNYYATAISGVVAYLGSLAVNTGDAGAFGHVMSWRRRDSHLETSS